MQYLFDSWYVAGWSTDVSADKPLARTYLDLPVMLFRDTRGRAVALLDRCPHRFAPLSRGRIKGDHVECGYHGLCFDAKGECVANPYGPKAPPRAQVRAFPLVEQQGIVWIWMGDPARADAAFVPDLAQMGDEANWHAARGYLHTPCNYQLGVDNLLDLTHPEFLHQTSLGSSALRDAHYEVIQEGDRKVHSNRWFDEGPNLPAMERYYPSGGKPVAHWSNMCWHAGSNVWMHVGVVFPGLPREQGLNAYSAHLLTPETATSTHYFFAIVRKAEEVARFNDAEQLLGYLLQVFAQEDSAMLQDVQSRMAGKDLAAMKPASLPGDAGAMRARELLARLVAAQSPAHAAAG